MSSLTILDMVEHDLAGIVGKAHVARMDLEINGVVPATTIAPGSPEEVAAVLSLANEFELVVAPAGGLTKQQMGGVPERIDILLSTTRMNQIEQYDPGDLTISVAAGMPFAAMQQQLFEHQQWVPCDAANLETATVGGLMATGAAGPLKSAFGHMRDFCIGVQFVTADGKVVKGGGRVVKNVAGYDLMKLLTGSFGSLAVITRAHFKVFPRPRQTRTFLCPFHSLDEALQFRTRIFGSPLTPMCLEIISPRAPEYLRIRWPCLRRSGRLRCAPPEATTCSPAMPASWGAQWRAHWKARRKSSFGSGFRILSRACWRGTGTRW
jgi:FAD/FMN-containing dehydrogenase